MITLRLKAYTNEEVKKLTEILDNAQKTLNATCASNVDCTACPMRHLCYDMCNALSFAEGRYKERTNRWV